MSLKPENFEGAVVRGNIFNAISICSTLETCPIPIMEVLQDCFISTSTGMSVPGKSASPETVHPLFKLFGDAYFFNRSFTLVVKDLFPFSPSWVSCEPPLF